MLEVKGVAITKKHLRVPIICIWICPWCGKEVRRQIIAERIKTSSYDSTVDFIYKIDYHDGCWNEAIEVQI